MNSSTDLRSSSRVLRGSDAGVVERVVLGARLEPCAPGEADAVDPRLRERSMQQGYQDGYNAGYQEGIQEASVSAQAAIQNATAALSAAAQMFQQRETSALEDAERQVVEAALAIAEEILGREVAASTNPGTEALARAIALAPSQGDFIVRMNPNDLAVIDESLLQQTGRNYQLVADSSIQPAGCVIDVGASRIDAQISTAIDRVREAMQ